MKIIVAVYDQKAEAYGRPIMEMTKGSAIRAFENELDDEKSTVKKFPQDFSLWQIGNYDERKGQITPIEPKLNLSNAWEVLQNKDREQGPRV